MRSISSLQADDPALHPTERPHRRREVGKMPSCGARAWRAPHASSQRLANGLPGLRLLRVGLRLLGVGLRLLLPGLRLVLGQEHLHCHAAHCCECIWFPFLLCWASLLLAGFVVAWVLCVCFCALGLDFHFLLGLLALRVELGGIPAGHHGLTLLFLLLFSGKRLRRLSILSCH